MARVFVRDSKKGLQVWWEVWTRANPRRRFPTGVFLIGGKKEQKSTLARELSMAKEFESITSGRDPLCFATNSQATPIDEEEHSTETVAQFVNRKLKGKNNPVLVSGYRKLEAYVKAIKHPCMKLVDFTGQETIGFCEWLLQDVKQSTAKGYLGALAVAFNDFVKDGEVECNPFTLDKAQFKRLFNGRELETELDIFTREQLLQLWNCDNEEVRNLVKVTFLCYGRRINEIVKLKWTDIDFKERFITFPTSKTGRICKVYIGDMLMETLEGMRNNIPTVFKGSFYSGAFSNYLLKVGMTKKGKKGQHRTLSHHAIRRTVETLLTDRFDHARAELLIGHVGKTVGMRHYYKAQMELYVEATEFLEQYIKG